MSALRDRFAEAKAEGRAALIGYLPAGFPSRADFVPIVEAMVRSGVDIVEIGLPYSDPLMDGPVIQEAVQRALADGTHISDVLEAVAKIASTGAPTLVMSYWNPIERYGVERFASELAAAGGVGVITPDLTPEEASEWVAATDKHGVGRVFLVAPSSREDRLQTVTALCSGFVYAASLMGVTGARANVSGGAGELVGRTRSHTQMPVAVGLGVSTQEQAAQVAEYADGVIVGSAFVKAVLDSSTSQEAIEAVSELAARLARGVRHQVS